MRRSERLASVLSFVSHPLVLVGVVVLLLFGLYEHLLEARIFRPVPEGEVAPVVHKLLDHGFAIGLEVVVLGFALQFYKVAQGRPLVVPSADRAAATAQRNRERMLERGGNAGT